MIFLLSLTCSRQKFEWGLPRLAHTQIPEAALLPATRFPAPGVWSVPGVPGKPLSGSSRQGGPVLSGRDPLIPRAVWEAVRSGGAARLPVRVSPATRGLSRLSPVPLGSFVQRAELRGRPGGSRGWGWGVWSAAEVC